MKILLSQIKRNSKLYFKDKGLFLTALITPLILLVLYSTFLSNVYKDSIISAVPEGFKLSENIVNGFSGAQLISSILSVSCVTVAFCSNMLMVQDKANSTIYDLSVTPIKRSTLALGYYFASLLSTLTVCLAAAVICFIYVGAVGWYLSFADVLLLLLDVVILVTFGVAFSSVINFFLSSQGQISAVGTIISSGYGFLSGAYMPLSQFPEGLREALAFLPGTYGTSLMRSHSMRGIFDAIENEGLPKEFTSELADVFDCNIYLLGDKVGIGASYAIVIGATLALIGTYVALNVFRGKKKA